jgi:RNA recognition motif-containing protein
VSKSTIVRDQLTGESKGFGFIETPNMDEASKGLTGVHLTVLDGKVLSVEYAKVPDGSQPPPPRGPLGAGGARQYTDCKHSRVLACTRQTCAKRILFPHALRPAASIIFFPLPSFFTPKPAFE